MHLYHVVQCGDPATEALLETQSLENVLISYAYHRDLRKAAEGVKRMRESGVKRLLLDCGAFTAKSLGIKLTLLDYERAIYHLQPDYYVQMDVIGSERLTEANLAKMHRDGFDPIPIFTRPAPFEYLAELTASYPWVALGNLNYSGRVTSLSGLRDYLDSVFAQVRTETRMHMFGIARVKILLQYPFYSCDTSEALKATGYGVVRDLRTTGSGESVASHMPHRDKESLLRYGHLSDIYTDGIDVKSGNRKARLRHNAANLDHMAGHVTKVWKLRGVEWDDPDMADYRALQERVTV